MASKRKRKAKRKNAAQLAKARWDMTTRAQTFADRTKVHDKQVARGRTARVNREEDLTD